MSGTSGVSMSYTEPASTGGTPVNFTIKIGATTVAAVAATTAFVGLPFTFTSSSGSTYSGTFLASGTVQF